MTDIAMRDVSSRMRVTVKIRLTGFKWWMFRMRCAIWIIKVASLVAPCRMSVQTTHIQEQP